MNNNDRNLFKKVYVEITNRCNLNCPFCLKSKREKKSLTPSEFNHILNSIKPYTKYLYLHVLGEPLVHQNINEFIDIASKDFYINLTTNGYLISNLKSNNVRQINISLHSFNNLNNKSLDDYMSDIFNYADINNANTYINYRLWTSNEFFNDIILKIEDHYHIKINTDRKNIKLSNNVYLNFDKEFIWPQDNKDNLNLNYKCYALKDHIAILSNGNIVPCCLDGDGKIVLGNIFKDDINDVISSDEFKKMKEELSCGKRSNELCKKCNFLIR